LKECGQFTSGGLLSDFGPILFFVIGFDIGKLNYYVFLDLQDYEIHVVQLLFLDLG